MPDFLNQINPNLVYAVLGVLAALIVLYLVLKMVGGRSRGRRGHRLGVVEYHESDQTRRLVLVRRDGVEHLVLIGGAHDVVVETGITPVHPHMQQRHEPGPISKSEEVVPLRAPRAPVFGANRKSNLQSVPPDPIPRDDEPTPA